MSLKLPMPTGHIPHRLEGTIDGLTPVVFQATRSLWKVAFGSWTFTQAATSAPQGADLRGFLYQAVACYRNAHRPQHS